MAPKAADFDKSVVAMLWAPARTSESFFATLVVSKALPVAFSVGGRVVILYGTFSTNDAIVNYKVWLLQAPRV